jgi:hypothetical protein
MDEERAVAGDGRGQLGIGRAKHHAQAALDPRSLDRLLGPNLAPCGSAGHEPQEDASRLRQQGSSTE